MKVLGIFTGTTNRFVNILGALAVIPIILIPLAIVDWKFWESGFNYTHLGECLLVTVLAVEGLVAVSELTHGELSASREQKERTAQIAAMFTSSEFRTIRRTAWKLRTEIVKNSPLADDLAFGWIVDEPNPASEWKDFLAETATCFSQMMEFYLYVYSVHRATDDWSTFSSTMDRYRYNYWRGSIIITRNACERIYNDIKAKEPELLTRWPCPSMVTEIAEMDQKYSSEPYSFETHPVDNPRNKERIIKASGIRFEV